MTKILLVLVLPLSLCAQGSAPVQTTAALATRMLQLMESTAVAVPDLTGASDPLRRQAESTLASMKTAPTNHGLAYRFISEVNAYLALSDSYPAPQLPAIAGQQFAELREDLSLFRQRFAAELESGIQARAAEATDPVKLQRYSEANAKLPPPGTIPRVVFLGDSIIEGWPLHEYFTGRDFVNRGIGGQTTLEMLGRFIEDVVRTHAKGVLILGGTNDLVRGISPGAVEDNLNMMGDLAKSHGIKPIFASLLPIRDDPAKIQEINRWLKDYCHRDGFMFLDFFTALADTSGRMPADVSDNGIDPNAKGYKIISPVALDAINRAMIPAPAQPPTRKRLSLPIIK